MHTGCLTHSAGKFVAGSWAGRPALKGTALVHVDFVLTGIVMTLLGPMLPMLSARWALNDAQAGNLFVAQFVTSMFGMLLSGVLVQKIGSRRTLVVGLILMALGMAALTRTNWILGIFAVSIYGIGFGSNTPAANLFVADANPGSRAAALNWLNSSWGIGAMGCPLLIAWAQRRQQISLFLYGMAVGLLALAACLLWVRFQADTEPAEAGSQPRPETNVEETSVEETKTEEKEIEQKKIAEEKIWSDPRIPLVSVLFFIYVGTETSTGGWVASYARRMDLGSHAFWATTPSFFWGALLIGRMSAPLLLQRMRETTVASIGLVIASLGIATMLAAQSMTLIVVGASLAGLGLASIYPISVSMLSHWFGKNATRVSGAVFAGGNLGGAALPWLVGAISTRYGGLRVGFLVPLLGALIMLTVYVANGSRYAKD